MNLLITATAGTMESNDIMVTLEPAQSGGIQISLTSNVLQQFGRQIEAVIRDTLTHYGIENAEVTAVDKGALDCTVRARVTPHSRRGDRTASSRRARIPGRSPASSEALVPSSSTVKPSASAAARMVRKIICLQ